MKKFVFSFLAILILNICIAQDKITSFEERKTYPTVRLFQQQDHLYCLADSLFEVIDGNLKSIDIGFDLTQVKVYDYKIELGKLIMVLSCKVFIYDIDQKESIFIDTSPIQYTSYENNCLHYYDENDELVSHYIDLIGHEINDSTFKYWMSAFNNYLGFTKIDENYFIDDIQSNQQYFLGKYIYTPKYFKAYEKLYYVDWDYSFISIDLKNKTIDTIINGLNKRLVYPINDQLIISRKIAYGISEISLFNPSEEMFKYRDTFHLSGFDIDYIYHFDTTGLFIYLDQNTLYRIENGEETNQILGDFITNNNFRNKVFFTTFLSQDLGYYHCYDINLNAVDTINKGYYPTSLRYYNDINNNYYTAYRTPYIFTGNKEEFHRALTFNLDSLNSSDSRMILSGEPKILLYDTRGIYDVIMPDSIINRYENIDYTKRFTRWENDIYSVEETIIDTTVKSHNVIKINPYNGQNEIVYEIGQNNIVDNIKYYCYAIGKSKIVINSNQSDSTIYCDLESGEHNTIDLSNFDLIGNKDDYIYYEDLGKVFKQHKFSNDNFEILNLAGYHILNMIGNYILVRRSVPQILKYKVFNINDFKLSELDNQGKDVDILYTDSDIIIYGNDSKLFLFDGNDSKTLITFNSTKSYSDIGSILSVEGNIIIYIKDKNTDFYKKLIYDKGNGNIVFDESNLVNEINTLAFVNNRNVGIEKDISANKNYLIDHDDQGNSISIINEFDIKGTLTFYAKKENILFFKYSHDETGEELAFFDANTNDFSILDLNPGHQSSSPKDFLFDDNYFYFFAKYENEGHQIWKLDLNGLLNNDEIEIGKPDQFKAFPNPTSGIISFEEEASVKILNFNGKVVFEAKDTKSIDLGHLPSAFYFIINNEGKSIKLIKL